VLCSSYDCATLEAREVEGTVVEYTAVQCSAVHYIVMLSMNTVTKLSENWHSEGGTTHRSLL
jgi:hypothetical protein